MELVLTEGNGLTNGAAIPVTHSTTLAMSLPRFINACVDVASTPKGQLVDRGCVLLDPTVTHFNG